MGKLPRCMAPWIHTHVTPLNKRALCCFATPFEESEESFENYWNNNQMKQIRLDMLKGNLPEEYCQNCLKNDALGKGIETFEVRDSLKRMFIDNTESDGAVNLAPISLDYRIDNECNLACRTCNSFLSSKIENEALKVGQKKLVLKNLNAIEEFKYHINKGKIKRIYFANGEPLIQKKTWSLLKEISEEQSKKITLELNTNLYHRAFFYSEYRQILKKFKEVKIAISIDDVGKNGEFIRDGLSWEKFKTNLYEIKNDDLFNITSYDITFTLPLLINIEPLIHFLIKEKRFYTIQMVYPGGYATLLHPDILDTDQLVRLYNRAIELILNKNNPVLNNFKIFLCQ